MTQTITLVRHGRSAHVHAGLIDLAGFRRWRADYEAAGINDEPPAELRALASTTGVVVASPARRAIESATLLDPRRAISTSPLLAELELEPPNFRRVHLPLTAWALAIAAQWAIRVALRRAHVSEEEVQRSRDAAAWLAGLAARHGSVLAVTHGSVRLLISDRLAGQGWRRSVPRNRSSHWSAWAFTR